MVAGEGRTPARAQVRAAVRLQAGTPAGSRLRFERERRAPRARAGELRGQPGNSSARCVPGRAREPCPSIPTPSVPHPLPAFGASPAALMEVQTFGGGRRCRRWAGARGAWLRIYRKQAREPIVGPPPPRRARLSLIWPLAANGQRPRHFKGRAAQSAAPPSAALEALFMPRGDFLSPETSSSSSLREFKWNNLPPAPFPRPSPRISTLALLPGLCWHPGAVAGLGPSGPSSWQSGRLLGRRWLSGSKSGLRGAVGRGRAGG